MATDFKKCPLCGGRGFVMARRILLVPAVTEDAHVSFETQIEREGCGVCDTTGFLTPNGRTISTLPSSEYVKLRFNVEGRLITR